MRVIVQILDDDGEVVASGSSAFVVGMYDSGGVLAAGTQAIGALTRRMRDEEGFSRRVLSRRIPPDKQRYVVPSSTEGERP